MQCPCRKSARSVQNRKMGLVGGKGRIFGGQDKRTWHYAAHVLEIIVVCTLFRWCSSGTPFFTPLVPRFHAKPWRCWFSAGTMAAECAIFVGLGRSRIHGCQRRKTLPSKARPYSVQHPARGQDRDIIGNMHKASRRWLRTRSHHLHEPPEASVVGRRVDKYLVDELGGSLASFGQRVRRRRTTAASIKSIRATRLSAASSPSLSRAMSLPLSPSDLPSTASLVARS